MRYYVTEASAILTLNEKSTCKDFPAAVSTNCVGIPVRSQKKLSKRDDVRYQFERHKHAPILAMRPAMFSPAISDNNQVINTWR